MGKGSVRVSFDADTSGLRKGVDAAAGTLKDFQSNASKAKGGAEVLGGMISNLGGASTAAGRAFGTLIGGFAMGGPMGLAIGSIQALSGWIKDSGAAAAKAAEEHKRWQENLQADVLKTTQRIREMNAEAVGGAVGRVAAEGANKVENARRAANDAFDKLAVAKNALADTGYVGPKAQAQFKTVETARRAYENELLKVGIAEREAAAADAKAVADAAKAAKDAAKAAAAEAKEAAKVASEAAAKAAAIGMGKGDAAGTGLLRDVEGAVGLDVEIQGADAARRARAGAESAKGFGQKDQVFHGGDDAGGALAKSNEALGADIVKKTGEEVDGIDKASKRAEAGVMSLGGALMELGPAFGGTAGTMTASFGKLIQQAVQLGVAMAASSGPWGWATVAAAAASMIATISGIPEFRERGGPVVKGMPYIVGEKRPEVFVPDQSGTILPSTRGSMIVNLNGVMDGPSVLRTLDRNARDVRRSLNRMNREGR